MSSLTATRFTADRIEDINTDGNAVQAVVRAFAGLLLKPRLAPREIGQEGF
jgi:hypothetical protein